MNGTTSVDEWEILLYCFGRHLGEKLGNGLPTQQENYILLPGVFCKTSAKASIAKRKILSLSSKYKTYINLYRSHVFDFENF